jgi:glycine cleavage system transcriptional repressor
VGRARRGRRGLSGMSRRTVLTAIGEDRPGLVEQVAEFVFTRGGSIEDSRMANLHGQFAIAMSIAGTEEAIDRITKDLDALSRHTAIDARLTPVPNAGAATASRLPYRLTGRALDQAGLVHQIANVLRSLDVNIENMETTLEAAPVTGAPVFAMDLTIAVPHDTPVQKLRGELARACDPLNVDWHLAPL